MSDLLSILLADVCPQVYVHISPQISVQSDCIDRTLGLDPTLKQSYQTVMCIDLICY